MQNSCLGVKLGVKLHRILFGVFSSKGQISIRVCFENSSFLLPYLDSA